MDTWRLPKQTLKYKSKLDKTFTENGHKDTKKQALIYNLNLVTTFTEDGHKQTSKQALKYKPKVDT